MKQWNKKNFFGLLLTALTVAASLAPQSFPGNMTALAEEGTSASGWICLDGKWYWRKEDKTALTGWLNTDGRTYYLDENGVMVRGRRSETIGITFTKMGV